MIAAACLLVSAMVGAGLGWFNKLGAIGRPSASAVTTGSAPPSSPATATATAPASKTATETKVVKTADVTPPPPAPAIKPGSAADTADKALQGVALWQLMKREFPEWYLARINDIAQLRSENKGEKAVTRHLLAALVKLRREHLNDALSATQNPMRVVAGNFRDNLARFAKHSTEACYGFVSQGEMSPVVLDLMEQPEHLSGIYALMATIFAAVVEGRKTPRAYPPPKPGDYQLLTAELTGRGWTDADLQLFSNAAELAKAKPEKVCGMVQDWFSAQLALKDEPAQLRLLAEALKPLIEG